MPDRPTEHPAVTLPSRPSSTERERTVQVALRREGRDAVAIIDTDPSSPGCGTVVEIREPAAGDGERLRSGMPGLAPSHGPGGWVADVAAHPGFDTVITANWHGPDVTGSLPALQRLLTGEYRAELHAWRHGGRSHHHRLDVGQEGGLVFRLAGAHNRTRAYGFAGVIHAAPNHESSLILWYLDRSDGAEGRWKARPVITIPAQRVDPAVIPPVLRGVAVLPPFLTDLCLSAEDRFLYLCCWGTGELRQYDVSDPFAPRLTGMVQLGGLIDRAAHPPFPAVPCPGGPQSVAVSRDGRRVYCTLSAGMGWEAGDHQGGRRGWLARLDVGRDGEITLDRGFLVDVGEEMRPSRIWLDPAKGPQRQG